MKRISWDADTFCVLPTIVITQFDGKTTVTVEWLGWHILIMVKAVRNDRL